MLAGRGKPASSLPESVVRYCPWPEVVGCPWGTGQETPDTGPPCPVPGCHPGDAVEEGAPGPSFVVPPAPPPPSGSLGLSEDSEGGIRGGELSQPPAWPQTASPAVYVFTGLTHSPPAGEGAERRKKGRNRGASERKERLVRGGGIIQKQHTCDIGPQNVGPGTRNQLETEAGGWLGTGGQCRRAARGSRALVPPFTSKHVWRVVTRNVARGLE